jgi:hypothetical protein
VKQRLQAGPGGGQQDKVISIGKNIDHFTTKIATNTTIINISQQVCDVNIKQEWR